MKYLLLLIVLICAGCVNERVVYRPVYVTNTVVIERHIVEPHWYSFSFDQTPDTIHPFYRPIDPGIVVPFNWNPGIETTNISSVSNIIIIGTNLIITNYLRQ